MKEKVLVTGASGYLGKEVVKTLIASEKYDVNVLIRHSSNIDLNFINGVFRIDSFSEDTDFQQSLDGIDVILHSAGMAHNQSVNIGSSYFDINHKATIALAKQALTNGISRFIFISTIGVNGMCSEYPFTESDKCQPHNDYALSKFNAEKDLLKLAQNTKMDVVIVRPPLIYGPNAPGNFGLLTKLISQGLPLPLALVTENKRSFVALDNIVAFLLLCIDRKSTPQASNQIFLISDNEDVSTVQFLCAMSEAFGKKTTLFPFPVKLLRLAANLLGKQSIANGLLNSLQINNTKARELTGWKPVVSMHQQLRKCIKNNDGLKN